MSFMLLGFGQQPGSVSEKKAEGQNSKVATTHKIQYLPRIVQVTLKCLDAAVNLRNLVFAFIFERRNT